MKMKKYTFFIVVLFYLLMLCVKIAHFTLFVQWRNSKVGLLKCVHLFPFIREPFVVCEFDLFIFLYFLFECNIACFCNTECKFIVRFMLNYRVKTVLINKKRSSLKLYRLSFVYLRYAARYALKSSHGRTRQ